jgi:hypothetical protein
MCLPRFLYSRLPPPRRSPDVGVAPYQSARSPILAEGTCGLALSPITPSPLGASGRGLKV